MFLEYWLKLATKAPVWNRHMLVSAQYFISQSRYHLAKDKVNRLKKYVLPTGKQWHGRGARKN